MAKVFEGWVALASRRHPGDEKFSADLDFVCCDDKLPFDVDCRSRTDPNALLQRGAFANLGLSKCFNSNSFSLWKGTSEFGHEEIERGPGASAVA